MRGNHRPQRQLFFNVGPIWKRWSKCCVLLAAEAQEKTVALKRHGSRQVQPPRSWCAVQIQTGAVPQERKCPTGSWPGREAVWIWSLRTPSLRPTELTRSFRPLPVLICRSRLEAVCRASSQISGNRADFCLERGWSEHLRSV